MRSSESRSSSSPSAWRNPRSVGSIVRQSSSTTRAPRSSASSVKALSSAVLPMPAIPCTNAIGAGGEFRIKDEGFRLRAKEPTDVVLVNAKLGPNGYTGWHGHVSQSLVVVKTGQITMYAPGKQECEASVHNAGTTFVHPEGAHNFVNTGRDANGAAV